MVSGRLVLSQQYGGNSIDKHRVTAFSKLYNHNLGQNVADMSKQTLIVDFPANHNHCREISIGAGQGGCLAR